MKRYLWLLLFFITTNGLALNFYQRTSWSEWVQQLKIEAVSQGIRASLFDQIFANLTPNQRILNFDRTQPEKRLTFLQYRNSRSDAYRIKIGQLKYRKFRQQVDKIGREYGVDPCFIIALWGMESSYGNFMGNFDVIRSLATLAYDSRRSTFFRKELLLALHMVNDGHVLPENFKGEWAGASGQSQFLPSSWHKYAVDYDHDYKKDIWRTQVDVFASIANYLHQNGWQYHQPVLTEVTLPDDFDQQLLGYRQQKTVQQWRQLGVKVDASINKNLLASIVTPYGGPTLMVFNNFKTLLTWNYSVFYVGTVNYLANKIGK